MILIKNFDKNLNEIDNLIVNKWKNSNNRINEFCKIHIIPKIDNNIKSLTVFDAKLPSSYKINKTCNENYNICNYLNPNYHYIRPYSKMPILDNCLCWSQNIIYCIYCNKC